MALVEERDDPVAGLIFCDTGANGYYGACAVGARDDRERHGEEVCSLGVGGVSDTNTTTRARRW